MRLIGNIDDFPFFFLSLPFIEGFAGAGCSCLVDLKVYLLRMVQGQ